MLCFSSGVRKGAGCYVNQVKQLGGRAKDGLHRRWQCGEPQRVSLALQKHTHTLRSAFVALGPISAMGISTSACLRRNAVRKAASETGYGIVMLIRTM